MRIRFFRAWASNNSGAYVLLGRFRDAAIAEAAAAELNEMLAAQESLENTRAGVEGATPLRAFADKHGLVAHEDWASWDSGMRCEVLGDQVLLEGYAADMPPLFVGWVAKYGGHVETEIVHAHGAVVLRAHVWVKDGWREEQRDVVRAKIARFTERVRSDVDVVAALERRRWGEVTRAVHLTSVDGPTELVLAPHDITRASKAIRRLADEEGVTLSFHVFEWIDDRLDPAEIVAAGVSTFDVMLDDPGPHPERVAAAITQIKGLELSYAEALVSNRPARVTGTVAPWPRKIANDVSHAHAEALAFAVHEAGALASVAPSNPRRF